MNIHICLNFLREEKNVLRDMHYFCIFNTALIKLLIFILLNIAYELCSKLELKDSYSA